MDVKTKIISQFIKDLSFENPKGPFPFAKKDDRPSISVTVDVKANATSSDNLYESILSIHVSATHQDNNVFLLDLVYQGAFEIENLTEDLTAPDLLAEYPRILFPIAG